MFSSCNSKQKADEVKKKNYCHNYKFNTMVESLKYYGQMKF